MRQHTILLALNVWILNYYKRILFSGTPTSCLGNPNRILFILNKNMINHPI